MSVITTKLELGDVLRSCYDSCTTGEPLHEIFTKDFGINIKKLTSLSDLCEPGIYMADVTLLSISPEVKFKPIAHTVRCLSCGYESDIPVVDGGTIPSKCPMCGNKNLIIKNMKTIPFATAKVSIEVEYEGARIFSLYDAYIIGHALKKIKGGFAQAIVYPHIVPVKRKYRGRESYDYSVVLYILDLLYHEEERRWSQVVDKLISYGAFKSYGDDSSIYDDLPVIPSVNLEQYLSILVSSFSPWTYGCECEKLLLLLMMVGGWGDYTISSRIRFTIHCLMIGDPSTGKSTLAQAVLETAPRAMKLTADLTSKTSLTAAEDRSGIVNPGPLAAMDGDHTTFGILVAEQIETWKRDVMETLRDILESCSFTRTIRGIYYQYNARCGLLATANWKLGIYQKNWTFLENLPDSVRNHVDLSRFDILIIMLTPPKEIMKKILKHKLRGDFKAPLTTKELRTLIERCRRIKPEVSKELVDYCDNLVDEMYKTYGKVGLEPLIRTADAYLRLATAFAKLTFSHKVTKKHVDMVKRLLDLQIAKVNLDIPTIPPYVLEIDPSKRKLKEIIFNMVVRECFDQDNGCDKDELLRKFKEFIDRLIELGKVTKEEIEKKTGGSIVAFFEKTLDELASRGLIYFPTQKTVKAVINKELELD